MAIDGSEKTLDHGRALGIQIGLDLRPFNGSNPPHKLIRGD
jgi:hypothetical protein